MVTENFVVKVSKIKNNKNRNYYVHRVNIPSEVVENLKLDSDQDEYLFLKAKKAEWYHMLDWSTMNQTWNKLPTKIKNEIISDGLIKNSQTNKIKKKIGQEIENPWTGTGDQHIQENYCIGSG